MNKKDKFINSIKELFNVSVVYDSDHSFNKKKRKTIYIGVSINNKPLLSYIKNNYKVCQHWERDKNLYMWVDL